MSCRYRKPIAALVAMTLVSAAGCGHSGVPDIFADRDGLWFGQASSSPFGQMPYGFEVSHPSDGTIVAYAQPPEGIGLPKGAYQRFTFADRGTVLRFESSLTGEMITGELSYNAALSNASKVAYCHREGCERMTADFAMSPAGQLVFTTSMGGSEHSVINLTQQPNP
ncbi:MAG: hypothetical protein ACI9MR_000712 [Myxococcota bacterium]|jgi:hypothetical protein